MSNTLHNIFLERERDLNEILDKLDDLVNDIDIDTYKHILKHIEASKNPRKLLNPSTIKVRDNRFNSGKSQSNRNNDLLDIEIDMSNNERICPISQAPIENLQTAECGHEFEAQYLREFIQKKQICPVPGCHKLLR